MRGVAHCLGTIFGADSRKRAVTSWQIGTVNLGGRMEASETRSIPVADIGPCPLLGKTNLERTQGSLADRLAKGGLPKPLLVRPSAEQKGPPYELIWGESWLVAAKQLGWTTIASRVETLSDEQALLAALREAAATGELNPVARARGYHRLREPPFNLSYKKIAAALGLKGPTSVQRFDALLLQPQPILDLLSQGRLHEGHLRYLNRVLDARDRVALAKRAAKGAWSMSRLRRRVGQPIRKGPARGVAGQGYDYNGFHLVRDGQRILFSGHDFYFARESPATYASALQTALESFIKNHMAEEIEAAMREIQRALESSQLPEK